MDDMTQEGMVCGPDGCDVPDSATATLPPRPRSARASTSCPTRFAPGAISASGRWNARWPCWRARGCASRCIGIRSSSIPTCRRRASTAPPTAPGNSAAPSARARAGCAHRRGRGRRRPGIPPGPDAADAKHHRCAPADLVRRRRTACRMRRWSGVPRLFHRGPRHRRRCRAGRLRRARRVWTATRSRRSSPATSRTRRCAPPIRPRARLGSNGVPSFFLDGYGLFSGAMPAERWRTHCAGPGDPAQRQRRNGILLRHTGAARFRRARPVVASFVAPRAGATLYTPPRVDV